MVNPFGRGPRVMFAEVPAQEVPSKVVAITAPEEGYIKYLRDRNITLSAALDIGLFPAEEDIEGLEPLVATQIGQRLDVIPRNGESHLLYRNRLSDALRQRREARQNQIDNALTSRTAQAAMPLDLLRLSSVFAELEDLALDEIGRAWNMSRSLIWNQVAWRSALLNEAHSRMRGVSRLGQVRMLVELLHGSELDRIGSLIGEPRPRSQVMSGGPNEPINFTDWPCTDESYRELLDRALRRLENQDAMDRAEARGTVQAVPVPPPQAQIVGDQFADLHDAELDLVGQRFGRVRAIRRYRVNDAWVDRPEYDDEYRQALVEVLRGTTVARDHGRFACLSGGND